MALVGSKAGCLSFAFLVLVVALFELFGLGLPLVLGCVSGLLVGLPRYTFLYTWRHFALF